MDLLNAEPAANIGKTGTNPTRGSGRIELVTAGTTGANEQLFTGFALELNGLFAGLNRLRLNPAAGSETFDVGDHVFKFLIGNERKRRHR